MSKIDDIALAVENGKLKTIEELVQAALAEGIDPLKILSEGLIGAMSTVGEKFQRSEIFIPEMLIAAKTMKKGLEILKPKLGTDAAAGRGKVIIGTVHGDLHDIGKNIVALMIESAGFEVLDLGVDVAVDSFVNSIKENPEVKLVALSCLLTTTMPAMQKIAEAVKTSGLGGFKLIVGGAPITQDFADRIGADGYSPDAASAVDLAKRLTA